MAEEYMHDRIMQKAFVVVLQDSSHARQYIKEWFRKQWDHLK